MKKILAAFIIITYIVLCSVIYELYRSNQHTISLVSSTKTEENTTKKQITLPQDAVKISECVPSMGEHWVRPQDIPSGPYYVVHEGKVLGLEFMFKPEEIPGEKTATMTLPEFEKYMKDNNFTLKDIVQQNELTFNLNEYEYDTLNIGWSAPHAGFPVPHIDIHVYVEPAHTVQAICPDIGIDQVYSPEVIKTIQEKNIPFPEKPKQ